MLFRLVAIVTAGPPLLDSPTDGTTVRTPHTFNSNTRWWFSEIIRPLQLVLASLHQLSNILVYFLSVLVTAEDDCLSPGLGRVL